LFEYLVFLLLEKIKSQYNKYLPFLDRLMVIYAAMDQKYQEAADYYGFHCEGCKDNCCLTRFYHHTLLEYLYILKGYNTLVPDRQIETKNRTLEVCRKTDEADEKGMAVRLMCPLNFDGLCILYNYRPMICRLHGIPHELQRAGQNVIHSPGCDAFTEQNREKSYFRFDRTPFYIKMAELENELKHAAGINQKLKMTVAEMLIEGLRD
jgi:Fe-S-cluster containining protein